MNPLPLFFPRLIHAPISDISSNCIVQFASMEARDLLKRVQSTTHTDIKSS